ncbi:MAG: type II toxin-antitoxin system VapC family toxin [Anaerolineae bacterium]
MMLIGGDTGFIIDIAEGKGYALEKWAQVVEGRVDLALSVVSINELLVYFYKRGKAESAGELLALMKALGNVHFWPVTEEIAERSAGYRYGLGMPAVDSLILATFVIAGCDLVLSADKHFHKAAEQKIVTLGGQK